jgi:hypothetical protein
MQKLSTFGDANVMKQMKSSHDEQMEVMGFPDEINTLMADFTVVTSS